MKIWEVLDRVSLEDARACLYYAGRYIKQADHFNKYKKDVFEEEGRSTVTDQVRDLTLRLVGEIEAREGRSADVFDDETVIRLLDEISSVEDGLVPELTEAESARARALSIQMVPPESKT